MMSKTCAYQNEPLQREAKASEVENPMFLVLAAMVSSILETNLCPDTMRAFSRHAWTIVLGPAKKMPRECLTNQNCRNDASQTSGAMST
jgi:hypothetical protein